MRFLPRIHFCWMTVLQQNRKKGLLLCLQKFLFNLWSGSQWSSTFPPVYMIGFGSCGITHSQRWGRRAGYVHHCWLNENPRAHSSSHYEVCLWSFSFSSWTSVKLHRSWLRGLPNIWKLVSHMNPVFKKINISIQENIHSNTMEYETSNLKMLRSFFFLLVKQIYRLHPLSSQHCSCYQ